jgi:hypothetical protein
MPIRAAPGAQGEHSVSEPVDEAVVMQDAEDGPGVSPGFGF